MELSSSRFRAFAVTLGTSFWFFVITSMVDLFSLEALLLFVGVTFVLTQIFSVKLSKGFDIFASFNTKLLLGLLFVTVISLYGILFKLLRIDLLRLQKQNDTYWLEMEQLKESRILKQY